MKNLCLLLLLLFLPLAAGSITKTITFSESDFIFEKKDGYDVVILKGETELTEVGNPLLPVKSIHLLIPSDAEIVDVKILNKNEYELPGYFKIHPAQKPFPLSHPELFEFTPPNKEIYESNESYPKEDFKVYPSGVKSGFRVAGIDIYPLHYKPKQQKLIITESITVQIEYANGKYSIPSLTDIQYDAFFRDVARLVINPEDISSFSPTIYRGINEVNYVIITSNALSVSFQDLVDWRTKQGWKAEVKTTEWIYSNYSGSDNQEKIRNFIKDYFATKGLVWVLLGGDVDIVPVRTAYLPLYGTAYIATDLYYSDLDGSWDGNHNNLYGEFSDDSVDIYSDVFVGRIPCATTENVTNYLAKQNTYEKNPPTTYLKKILLPSVGLWGAYHGRVCNNAIANIIPSDWFDAKLEDPANFVMQDSLNQGYQFCHPAAHGNAYGLYNESGIPIFQISQIASLTNGTNYTMMNSIACYPGAFDLYNDCLAESLVNKYPGACVATIMNTRYGWGSGTGITLSEALSCQFYETFFNQDTFEIGRCHACTKDYFRSSMLNNIHWRYCGYVLTLFGDPAIPMWENIPVAMDVTKPDTIIMGIANVSVTVTSFASPLNHALVCLYKNGEIHERGYTNSSGQVVFNIVTNTPGTMSITVTAKDKYPYEGSIYVKASDYAYVGFLEYTISDPLPGGNNNGQLNPGESAEIPLWVKNWGGSLGQGITGRLRVTDMYATFSDTIKSFGNIAAGDSAFTGANGYNVNISTTCPNGYTVLCTLICKNDVDSTWISYFNMPVYAAILVYQSNVVDDGWDGRLDPGETADLIVTIRNDGGAWANNISSKLKTASPYITINDSLGNFGSLGPNSTANNSGDPYQVYASASTPGGTFADFSIILTYGVLNYCDTLNFGLIVGHLAPTDTTKAYVASEWEQRNPQIAFGNSNYLAVWWDDRRADHWPDGPWDIYATRVTLSGQVVDTCGIYLSNVLSGDDIEPDVAFDGTNYLVVWINSSRQIYGARITQDGVVLDPGGFPIITTPGQSRIPSVAFNGTNYLVTYSRDIDVALSDYAHHDKTTQRILGTWTDDDDILGAQAEQDIAGAQPDTVPLVNYDLYGVRVTPGGTVLDPGGFLIKGGSGYQVYPSVTSNGTGTWFVTWHEDAADEIRGARVSSAGVVLDPGGILISSGANDRLLPDVAFDGTNYFCVWQDKRSGTSGKNWSVYGARISQSGTVLDPSGIAIAADDAVYEGIPAIGFNGTNYLVIWKDDGNDYNVHGARVSPAGVILDTRFPISGAAQPELFFDVASDGSNWLCAWQDARYMWGSDGSTDPENQGRGYDIGGARVNSAGVVLDPYPNDIPMAIGGDWQYHSSAAFDGTNYLLVWQQKRVEGANWDILGCRLNSSGTVLDIPPLNINTASGHQVYPDVAFGNTNYLVIWQVSGSYTAYIYGARVGLNGTILDPVGIQISSGITRYPAVAFDGTNYVVVWVQWYNSAYRIFAARVTQSGVLLDPGGVEINQVYTLMGWNNKSTIGIAFDGANYLVIWPDGRNGDWDIYGARFTPDLTVLDPTGFKVAGVSYCDQDHPNLCYGNGKYFAVWNDIRGDGDIYGTFITPSGVSLDTLGFSISNTIGVDIEPSVSCIGSKYVVAWRTGSSDIYGTRVDTSGVIMDPYGFIISNETYRQFDPCVTAGPWGKALLSFSSFTDAYPYSCSRLYHTLKTIDPDLVPPSAPYVFAEKTDEDLDVVLTWNKITTDILGNPEAMDHYTVYRSTSPSFIPGASDSIAGIAHPDTVFTDTGVLDSLQSYYYLVKAADQSDNRSAKSNMAYKLNKFVNENAGATGDRNWVSLPWYSEYDSVLDLTADLSPAGDPLSKITNLGDDQVFENWIYHPVLGWYGDTFDINAGRAYEMIVTTDDTVILVGSNDPVGFIPLNENPGAVGDRNWVSIPYNALYDRAIDITDEYSSGGEAVIKITDLRDDQIFRNWIYHPVLGWYGDTFDISAGRGYEFVAVLDTTWNPTEYTNESGFDRLAARHTKSDIKVRLGILTKVDRAPLWVVDEDISDKTVSRSDIKDPRKEACLSEPKSEKSVKSADEHDVKNYKPVARSVSLKKSLKLYREAGVSHLVRAEFDAAEYTDLVFTAYRLNKPYDVLTEQVIGSGIAQKHDLGVLWFDVGNFMQPWQHGEEMILIIEALHEHGVYYQVIRFGLDQGVDIQELGKLEFEPMPKPEPVLNAAVSWTKSKNVQVIGYSVYQSDIRANHEVIQAQKYSGSKDITLKLVIKGGYETVYNSGSKRTVQGPVVELPRVYAFTVYPNPFIKKTMINYALPEPGQVSIMVYDVTGRKVITLVNDRVDPGYYQVHWSGRDDLGRQVSAGVYFMRMNTPGFNSQQKVIFVR